ncbi:MAG: hypothetical protein ACYCVL_11905 [Gemmatimonadaceae bacterium]
MPAAPGDDQTRTKTPEAKAGSSDDLKTLPLPDVLLLAIAQEMAKRLGMSAAMLDASSLGYVTQQETASAADAINESRRIFQRVNSYAIYRIAETMGVLPCRDTSRSSRPAPEARSGRCVRRRFCLTPQVTAPTQ